MSRIGIFAGAFDPIHSGHIAFAQKAMESGLQKVYFMPETKPAMKPHVTSLAKRVAQIEKNISSNKDFEVITAPQDNFKTNEILDYLEKEFPDKRIVFLFGDDVLEHLVLWEDIEILANKTDLLIATRNYSPSKIKQMFSEFESKGMAFSYQIIELDEVISSTQIRNSR